MCYLVKYEKLGWTILLFLFVVKEKLYPWSCVLYEGNAYYLVLFVLKMFIMKLKFKNYTCKNYTLSQQHLRIQWFFSIYSLIILNKWWLCKFLLLQSCLYVILCECGYNYFCRDFGFLGCDFIPHCSKLICHSNPTICFIGINHKSVLPLFFSNNTEKPVLLLLFRPGA